MSKTSPARWWRDDATRYQGRPPYRAAQDRDLQFIRPTPLTDEQLKYLDDVAREHERHQAELKTWAAGGPSPTLGVPIEPVEFERLDPQPWSAEQQAELGRDRRARGAQPGGFDLMTDHPDRITMTSRNPLDVDVATVDVPLVPADARTVLPGQPVRYHGGIALGTPIPPQPDPDKIIGTIGERQPEPELPPIPGPGFYWAKLADWPDEWTVVQVSHTTSSVLGEIVEDLQTVGRDYGCDVVEWGPKLEPPR